MYSPIISRGISPIFFLVLFCLLIFNINELQAKSKVEYKNKKIGLVLSGGGARGAAHLGVLKEIERLHIPIDYIAGTSMGAIIGGLYASGMSVQQIEQALGEIDWADILRDRSERSALSYRRKRDDDDFLVASSVGLSNNKIQLPTGLLQGQRLLLLLKSLTLPVATVRDFDQLVIPFRAIATDISTGKAEILSSGDLATAMRASASIPSAFAPVKWQGKLLVDGGVADNLPVDVVKKMGATHVIAIDVSTPLYKQDELTNALTIADQLSTILTRNNTERSLALLTTADVLIVPELADISTTSFDRSMDAIDPGEVAARSMTEQLRTLQVNPQSWQEYQISQQRPQTEGFFVSFVEINNQSDLSDELIKARIHIPVGKELNIPALDADIGHLYGMDLFEQVNYDLITKNGKQGVRINVQEKSWGPGYIHAGLTLHSQWNGRSGFTVGAAYNRTAINDLGGEWRSIINLGEHARFFTEFYQPLDARGRFFVNPGINIKKTTVGLYEQGQHLADYELAESKVFFEVGRELSNWGEARIGLQYAKGKFKLSIGDNLQPEVDFDSGMMFARLGLDTLDNRYFANEGDLLELEFSAYRDFLGGDDNFDQLSASWFGARTYNKATLLFKASANITLDDNAPVYARQTLGGFFNLSGYNKHELSGQQSLLMIVGGMYRVLDSDYMPIYAGATLEAGNTWGQLSDFADDFRYSGSLFVGGDSFLGPLFIGVSAADQGHGTMFLFLGSPF